MFTCSSICQATQESFHYVETSLSLLSATRKQLIMLPQLGFPSSVSEILAAVKELSLKESMPSMKPTQSSVKRTSDVGTKII